MTDEFAHLLWPWSIPRYPGAARALGELLGIRLRTAEGLLSGHDRLPLHHAKRLATFLESRLAVERALLERLRDEIATGERERSLHPHKGYQALLRWRRQQQALKADRGVAD